MTKRTIENSRLRRIVMVFGLGAVAIALGGGISWWLALVLSGAEIADPSLVAMLCLRENIR